MIGWHNAGTRTRVPQPILASPGTIVTHIDFLLPSHISGGNPSSSVSVAHQFRVTLKGNCCAAHLKKAENPSACYFVAPALRALLGRSWHRRWRGARRRVLLVAVPVRPRRLATAILPLHHRPRLRPKTLPAMAFIFAGDARLLSELGERSCHKANLGVRSSDDTCCHRIAFFARRPRTLREGFACLAASSLPSPKPASRTWLHASKGLSRRLQVRHARFHRI